MASLRRPEIAHRDRRRIYEFVEEGGVVERDAIPGAVGLDRAGVRHHLAILERDGLIETREGRVRVALERGAVEEGEAEGIAYRIRAARQEDLGGIVGVMREVVAAGTYVEAETVAEVVDHEEVLLRLNARETRMFFVATIEDDVVGWVHIEGSTLAKLAHTAELTVGLLGAYRNRGIGSHLLARGLEWAAQQEYERVYQSVPATNERAIDFLTEHGWTVEAIRADHYRIDGEHVDEVMLAVTP